jgi:structural maintenance of chromosome 2
MFNNANVIFRTKFVDGVSTVTRSIGVGLSRPRGLVDSENTQLLDASGKHGSQKTRKRGKENSIP